MIDIETAIMIKNIAREAVKKATVKNDKSFRAQMNATDIIGWKSLLTSIKSGKTKASDYENGLSDEDAIKILEKKISQAR